MSSLKEKEMSKKERKKWLCDIENWHVFSPSFTGVSSKKMLQRGVVLKGSKCLISFQFQNGWIIISLASLKRLNLLGQNKLPFWNVMGIVMFLVWSGWLIYHVNQTSTINMNMTMMLKFIYSEKATKLWIQPLNFSPILSEKLKILSLYLNEVKWERCGKIITFGQHCTKIKWLDSIGYYRRYL